LSLSIPDKFKFYRAQFTVNLATIVHQILNRILVSSDSACSITWQTLPYKLEPTGLLPITITTQEKNTKTKNVLFHHHSNAMLREY